MNERPDQRDIDSAFEVFSEDRSTVHRRLTTLLYIRHQKWHDVRGPGGDSMLLAASRQGHSEAVTLLLQKGFAADAWNDQLDTALHLAQDTTTAGPLMSATSDRLALEANAAGELPLHTHLRDCRSDVVQLLMASSTVEAQIVRPNRRLETPIFQAAQHAPEFVLPMILAGADPRKANVDGQVAADLCGDPKATKILRAFSSHLTRCDEAARQRAMDGQAAQAILSLAQQAKAFLNGPQCLQAQTAAATIKSGVPSV